MEQENKQTSKDAMDFTPVLNNIECIKKMKAAKKGRKPTVSLRPLKFDLNPEDSPLKSEIIKRINDRNLTYGDLYKYCTEIKDGNAIEGQKFGYNLISSLRNCHSMIDSTFSLLCDFLNLDVLLVDRTAIEKADDDAPYADDEDAQD